jgi:hypothetical protein
VEAVTGALVERLRTSFCVGRPGVCVGAWMGGLDMSMCVCVGMGGRAWLVCGRGQGGKYELYVCMFVCVVVCLYVCMFVCMYV